LGFRLTVTEPLYSRKKVPALRGYLPASAGLVEAKPDGKTGMMVGKTSYKSKDEADKALKAAAKCKK
jgi:hypothetical protein